MTAAVSAAWHWFVLYQRNNGKTVHWSTDSPSNLSPKAVTSWQSLSYRIREKVMICFHLFDSGFHKLLGAAEHQNKWRHWYISVSILTDIFGSNVHNCENVLKYCVCVCAATFQWTCPLQIGFLGFKKASVQHLWVWWVFFLLFPINCLAFRSPEILHVASPKRGLSPPHSQTNTCVTHSNHEMLSGCFLVVDKKQIHPHFL